MAGFDILSLIGEPWNDSGSQFRGIGVTVTDTASLPSSKFLEFVLNGASVYSVLKTGETVISDPTGTSLGGMRLAGSAGEMALTSQMDTATAAPAEVLRYSWENTAQVGSHPSSVAVLQGMGASNFSIEGPGAITHIAGSSVYKWAGIVGPRVIWGGYDAASANGKTIDVSNVGQATRASPVMSVSAENVGDDLVHFGLSDGTNWSVGAKIDAAGRGQFQMVDLPAQGAPGIPAASMARIYGKNVGGTTKVAFCDSAGAETVLGSTISVAGGTVATSTPVANFSQTWNGAPTAKFSAITAAITDQQSSASSNLLDLTVNGRSAFTVLKTGQNSIDLGTVSTSTPFVNATATLDDGSYPGAGRQIFYGAVYNWNRTNVGGGNHPQFELRTENQPWFRLTPDRTNVTENGGVGAAMTLLSKSNPNKNFGLELQGTLGSVGYVKLHNARFAHLDWEGGVVGQVATTYFYGTNRACFDSAGAFSFVSRNGLFEFEANTGGTGRITMPGYYAGSAVGCTIDFNNFNQTPARANPVISISTETAAEDALHICRIAIGGIYTTLAKFDGSGVLTTPGVFVGADQVVGARRTGWAAPTGTASRDSFDPSTVALPDLAATVKALIDDLTAHGLVGA